MEKNQYAGVETDIFWYLLKFHFIIESTDFFGALCTVELRTLNYKLQTLNHLNHGII